LAAGLDKARSDYAVAIWDISAACKYATGFHSDIRPTNEFALNETANSVAWVQAKSILVGMNGKHIKLFDLRGVNNHKICFSSLDGLGFE